MRVREFVQDLLLADQDAEVFVVGPDGGNVVRYDDWSAEYVDEYLETIIVSDGLAVNAVVLWPVS